MAVVRQQFTFIEEEPELHDDSPDETVELDVDEEFSSSGETPHKKAKAGDQPYLNEGPSGTNVSVDRDFTIKAAVPPVLYQLEWVDRGTKKPSFYSSTPFTNLTIVKDTVSKRYQAPETSGNNKTIQPIIEVVTRINGTAERDKVPAFVAEPFPPPPQIPVPAFSMGSKKKKVSQPKPYKLEEIAIDSLGKTRILIHSPHLLRALKSVITYYPLQRFAGRRGVAASIVHPYICLVHHRDALVDFSRNGNDEYKPPAAPTSSEADDSEKEIDVTKMMDHMKVLLDFFDPHYQIFMQKAGDRLWRASPVATFEEAWYLFPPGTDVYISSEGKVVGAVVIGAQFDADNDLEIKVWYLAFDGKQLKRRSVVTYISEYDGEEEIVSLPVCPAAVWDIKDGGKRRKAFENRGETIFRLCKGKSKQVYYNGPDENEDLFKGLVIIDNEPVKNLDFHDTNDGEGSVTSYATVSSDSRPPPPREAPPRARLARHDRRAARSPTRGTDPGDESDTSSSGSSIHRAEVKKSRRSEFRWAKYMNLTVESELTKHHYMLFHPFIMGFAVLAKKWKVFDIDFVTEIPKREDMIDNVVMESAKQQIIKAISHPQNHAWKLDFIQGKGEGQIVLLHGPPGVGKTYTVECAAEATGRPLIFLTIADIGLDEKRIEDQMTKWFSLAERWEAILLIDEADIFLERRRGADIARNSLVSVFLRKMEYFQGLLFLTTNRIGQIDDAFLSRIHVVIGYTPLTEEQRATIWKGFFRKLEHDMKLLSAEHAKNKARREEEVREARKRDKSREKNSKDTDDRKDEPKKPEMPLVKIQVSKYAKEYVLNDPEVRALKWNGREIRNSFQTAISLAGFEASQDKDGSDSGDDGKGKEGKLRVVDVSKEHFVSVVKMSKEFHSYMDSISMQEEAERARGRLERNDAFVGGEAGGGSLY